MTISQKNAKKYAQHIFPTPCIGGQRHWLCLVGAGTTAAAGAAATGAVTAGGTTAAGSGDAARALHGIVVGFGRCAPGNDDRLGGGSRPPLRKVGEGGGPDHPLPPEPGAKRR
jgi:hypothetical protein